MKKILYVASKVKLHINLFHIPFLEALKKEGYEVHVAAANDYETKEDCVIPGCDVFYDLSFNRIPIHISNLRAYSKLRSIISSNEYDIIHCHTPVGAAVARLAARKSRKKGTKVIYTAHGFHFYKGAPIRNWLFFYMAERLLARYTDWIITINDEDYMHASRFRKSNTVKMHGVGVDLLEFTEADSNIRTEMGLSEKSTVLFFAGELSYRKHQDFLIEALSRMKGDMNLLLAGEGSYFSKYKNLAENLGVEDRVAILGFRKDIARLMKSSDICVSAARHEGLPVNIIEAMASGLPVVCFDIRGNTDLVTDGKGGYLIKPGDMEEFCLRTEELVRNPELRKNMGKYNIMKAACYSRGEIVSEMMDLYRKVTSV